MNIMNIMNIIDRDILKYALLVVIGYMICKRFLNSYEGYTCRQYVEDSTTEGADCQGDPNNPSESCCNKVMNLPVETCWPRRGRGHTFQAELDQRIEKCNHNLEERDGILRCFPPGSGYTFDRCCDNSKGPLGDEMCWGDGHGFYNCCQQHL